MVLPLPLFRWRLQILTREWAVATVRAWLRPVTFDLSGVSKALDKRDPHTMDSLIPISTYLPFFERRWYEQWAWAEVLEMWLD